ncbi:hypothetical protein [Herbidospora mongoliensis]|uniref:hypothetical protein n=1 Tax=Herbidospora mongoliensis TaxID=688067 RepID=UPI00083208C5|nr:hypothetical protein [Herbidospora mongoliensis]
MSRASWIGHPLTVLALVVLVLNDHLLKYTWPGIVTGKLSDVAGLILLPPLLGLVIGRPLPAIAITGIGFTLVKASETGAWLASEAWSLAWGPSLIRADLTDLLALPALYVAWHAARHPVPAGRTAVILLTPAAVLAITATGPEIPYIPTIAFATEVRDGGIIVHVGRDAEYSRTSHFITRDGRIWEEWEGAVLAIPASSSCAGDRCFRVVPGRLKVEESAAGGAWTAAWEVSPRVQDRLVRAHPPDRPEDVQPVESLSVSAIPGLVVVANGADGVAVRDGVGTWRRVGIDDDELDPSATVSVNAPGLYSALLPENALLIGIVAGLFALGTGVRRLGFAAGVAVGCAGAWYWLAPRDEFNDVLLGGHGMLYPHPLLLLPLFLLPVVAFALMVFFAVMVRPPAWLWPFGLATTGLVWLVIMAPFEAWSADLIPTYDQASVVAVVLATVVGTLAAVVTARYATPRPRSLGHWPSR